MKRKTDNFDKFFNKKRNSAIKEQFKQEKKAAKKERKEAIDRHFEAKRQARQQQFGIDQTMPPGRKGRVDQAPSGRKGKAGPASASGFKAAGKPGPIAASGFKATGKHAGAGAPVSKGSAQAGKGFIPAGKGIAAASAPASAPKGPAPHDPNVLPLNKYIAHGGICSRRDAAELIKQGKVLVNGQLVTEPGTKVFPDDLVKVNGKKVTMSRNFVYILLNKPKDYITTSEDPQGRKTVLDLIRHATTERVYPVGRLDRNTSGVLLFTNDGDLAQKLAHPKHEIKKIYHVSLDKPLTKADFDKIIGGAVVLEDGVANVDVLAYADPRDKTQIGLEIHSGRNRIVRRIFEHLGYDVRGLDRVMYAGLTKKNVQRGKWRLLTEKEIRILKYLNSSTRGAAPDKAAQTGKQVFREEAGSFSQHGAEAPGKTFSPEKTASKRKEPSGKKGKGRPVSERPKRPSERPSSERESSGRPSGRNTNRNTGRPPRRSTH